MDIKEYINQNYEWIDIDKEKPETGRDIVFSDEYSYVSSGEFNDKWEKEIDMSPFGVYDYPFENYNGNIRIERMRFWMYKPDYWDYTPDIPKGAI